MKIICSRKNPDGNYAEVGMTNQFLTSSYTTVKGFLSYGLPDSYRNIPIRLQIWRGDNIYRDPDKVLYVG